MAPVWKAVLTLCGLLVTTVESSDPVIDLGYAVYRGARDSFFGLNTFKGIRFAAPPIGVRRWHAPTDPDTNRSAIINATSYGSRCPQAYPAPFTGNSFTTPPLDPTIITADPYFQTVIQGSEDCLFLNIYAPPQAKNLPVLVWIHGGGYGFGHGTQDLSPIINASSNGFVGVSIQYRLGAFGWLSSEDVKSYGALNAGLLDQNFALHWVQQYITLFGGNPQKVTIAGESAGAGSVMLHGMAYGGGLGSSLFSQLIAASPYLPKQYGYADAAPTQLYGAFASLAGCDNAKGGASAVFDCLISKDTITLQQANAVIDASGLSGTWTFLPVTDGVYVQERPSEQLLTARLNGDKLLTGNNADEGALFVPANITTEVDFENYIRLNFPMFSNTDVANIVNLYPSTSAPVNPAAPLFATLGDTGPTALNQSIFATGQQQRADNLYAEFTFVCPSYWLAAAYSQSSKKAYKYQFSVPPAYHTSDIPGYFGPLSSVANLSPEFQLAFMNIWSNFIIGGNPSISTAIALGNATAPKGSTSPASSWPPYYPQIAPYMINLNETGGTPGKISTILGPISTNIEPGLENDIKLVNAYSWEGGRGARCDCLRTYASKVPQ